ncbi:MAG: hypothetical protein Q4F65_02295 [Propionibacteriaceae bacterium]|nr:hypothetical protein [Propionibacteriaceae bacterium]
MSKPATKTALALAGTTMALMTLAPAMPAHAFTSSSSATVSGVTYRASATSCNSYWTSCSWNTSARTSVRKTFRHTSDVKANGIGVSVTISASPGITITGNSTSMAHASKSVYGTYSSMSGVARPSILSLSVAARSILSSSAGGVSTGWTTW